MLYFYQLGIESSPSFLEISNDGILHLDKTSHTYLNG